MYSKFYFIMAPYPREIPSLEPVQIPAERVEGSFCVQPIEHLSNSGVIQLLYQGSDIALY